MAVDSNRENRQLIKRILFAIDFIYEELHEWSLYIPE